MIALPVGTQVWLAAGVTDMRKGMDGLAALVQTPIKENPFSGQLFVFGGSRGDLVNLLWFDGNGLYWPNAWSAAATFGRKRLTAPSPSPRHSYRCCLKALIGAGR